MDPGEETPPKRPKIENESGDPPSCPLLDLLPDDLILRILSFLTFDDLALGVSAVNNRRLRNLCLNNNNNWFSSIVIPERRSNPRWNTWDARSVILRSGERLVDLRLTSRVDSNKLAIRALVGCPNLESLTITSGWKISSDLLLALDTVGDALRKLVLDGGTFLDPKTLLRHAGSLCRITWLDLGEDRESGWSKGADRLDGKCLRVLADVCGGRLEHFGGRRFERFGDEDLAYFLERCGTTLRHLELRGNEGLTDAKGYGKMGQLCCGNLQILELEDVSNLGRSGLSSIVGGMSELTKLSLVGRRLPLGMLSGDDFVAAFKGEKRRLTSLEIEAAPGLDDSALGVISAGCPNLVGLSLVRCPNVTEEGLKSYLRRCEKLHHFEKD